MPDRLPKLCYHRATGRYYVTLGGKEVYLGSGKAVARRERDRILAEWLANGRQLPPRLAGPRDLLVVELIDRYRVHCIGYYVHQDGTPTGHVERSIKPAMRTLRRLYGQTIASDFGPLALQALRGAMIGEGLSRRVVNARASVIKRMFRWAAAQELVEARVYHGLAAVAGIRVGRGGRETAPITPVADELVDLTLSQLPLVIADMVRLQRLTGARPDEICRLRPCDVDQTGDVWLYRPDGHKTSHHGRDRIIYIGPRGKAVLSPYLTRERTSYCFVPRESEARRRSAAHQARITPASCGNRPGTNRKRKPRRSPGGRYNTGTYRRAIHRAADKANDAAIAKAREAGQVIADGARLVPRWGPNRLRHSSATELRSRYGIEVAQIVLGHADPKITLTYAAADAEKAIAAIRLIG